MTVRFLTSWNGYSAGDRATLGSTLEASLISGGLARAYYVQDAPVIAYPPNADYAAAVVGAANIVPAIDQSAVAASLTGTTAETTLASITVPAMGRNDSVRVTALFTFTSSVNLKTMFVKLNGSTFAQNSTSTSGHTAARMQVQVMNRNSTSSQLGTLFGMGFTAGAAVTPLNPSVDTSGSNTILIRAQLASSGETITLEGYTVELIKGPA